MSNLREQFEGWLDVHFEAATTQSGSVARTGQLPRYHQKDETRLNLLLGGAFGWEAVNRWRRERTNCHRLRRAIESTVETWEAQELLRFRRDEALSRQLRQARSMHERHGSAPDGGELIPWARRVLDRLNETFGVDDAPDVAVWHEVVGAPANARRRERRAA